MRSVIPNWLKQALTSQIRYVAVILNGARNPHRSEVAKDITDAVLKTRASEGTPATYWSQSEQEIRLEAAYNKWAAHGGVWSAAAREVRQSWQLEINVLLADIYLDT